MNRVISLFTLLLSLTLIVEKAHAYEVIEVEKGGTVKGRVSVEGSIPEDEILQISQEVDSCGASQRAEKYLISTDGDMKNVVVWIKDVKISNTGCRIVPLVSIGYTGGRFLFENQDSILHQMHLCKTFPYQKKVSRRPLLYGATVYNVALPIALQEVAKEITPYLRYTEEGGYMNIICNRHPWERGYVFIFDHPYAALTGDAGEFEIGDIPPGKYTLNFWHEGLKSKNLVIEVNEGEITGIQVEMGR
jgi:hypothetical protein